MRRPTRTAVLGLALVACLGGGSCVSLGSPPLEPRYFRVQPDPIAADSAQPMRLGDVRAAGHLRERIAWTDAAGEIGFYEEWRWSELPADTLRLALARAFARPAASGAARRRVDVELLAFEVARGGSLRAVLELDATLVLRSIDDAERRTIRVEKPLSGEDPRQLARALEEALEEACAQLVQG